MNSSFPPYLELGFAGPELPNLFLSVRWKLDLCECATRLFFLLSQCRGGDIGGGSIGEQIERSLVDWLSGSLFSARGPMRLKPRGFLGDPTSRAHPGTPSGTRGVGGCSV